MLKQNKYKTIYTKTQTNQMDANEKQRNALQTPRERHTFPTEQRRNAAQLPVTNQRQRNLKIKEGKRRKLTQTLST